MKGIVKTFLIGGLGAVILTGLFGALGINDSPSIKNRISGKFK